MISLCHLPRVASGVIGAVCWVSKNLPPVDRHPTPIILFGWFFAIVAAFMLVACGESDAVQTGKTAHYTIQLGLSGTGFGERTATIQIVDEAGQPASVTQIVVEPVMEQMGMAAPEVVAEPLSSGYYQAKGVVLSMIGEWSVRVRVTAGGNEEIATFKVQVTDPRTP